MSAKISLAVSAAVALFAGIFCASSANAQGASSPSLADQLKAQYKLAKIVPESNSYKVAEPGTMLVIQKDGIFGVPLGNNSADPVIYAIHKDADLHHSATGANAWKFAVGHKVYLSKLDVDPKHEKVFLTIVECDSSNPAKPSYYKSLVDFEFPDGYLAAAEVGQIESVISQVLTIDSGTNDPQPATNGSRSSSTGLTNDDIIKLAQAKLPDAVVIAKIKSSTCDFDSSPDGLIKLKQAGVSDSVLQAILDAQPAVNAEAATPDPSALSLSSLSQYLNTRWPDRLQSPPQCTTRLLQRLQNAGYRTITDLDTALSNGSQKLAEGEAQGLDEGGIYRPCGLVSATLQATDPQFRAAREEAVTPPAPGTLSFSVRHRHSLWETSDSSTHYCSGTLSVSPDGTVAYDCAQTDDPDGRCEHVSLPPGSLKDVKMGSAGNVRLTSTTRLNYDFYGNSGDIKQVQAAISRLIQPGKK